MLLVIVEEQIIHESQMHRKHFSFSFFFFFSLLWGYSSKLSFVPGHGLVHILLPTSVLRAAGFVSYRDSEAAGAQKGRPNHRAHSKDLLTFHNSP